MTDLEGAALWTESAADCLVIKDIEGDEDPEPADVTVAEVTGSEDESGDKKEVAVGGGRRRRRRVVTRMKKIQRICTSLAHVQIPFKCEIGSRKPAPCSGSNAV